MSESKRTVLQIEFFPQQGFHKTTIRIFDPNGTVTGNVSRYAALKTQQAADIQNAAKQLGSAGAGLWRSAQDAGRRMHGIQNAVESAIRTFLAEHPKPELAIEIHDRSFRPVEDLDEYQRLSKVARDAKGMWVFVFEADDLVNDGKLMSAMM